MEGPRILNEKRQTIEIKTPGTLVNIPQMTTLCWDVHLPACWLVYIDLAHAQ